MADHDDTGRDEPTTQNEELIGVLKFAASAGLRLVTFRQSSRVLAGHFARLIRAAARAGIRPPARESRSWRTATGAGSS